MMRKGYRREAGSEGSAKQRCEPMEKNRIRGASAGRAGNESRSPYPSTARSVDPVVAHRRRLSFPREICRVSPLRRLRKPEAVRPRAAVTSSDGAATSVSARPHVCAPTWKRGSAEDYARIFGTSGRTGTLASTNCAVVAYRSSMQR